IVGLLSFLILLPARAQDFDSSMVRSCQTAPCPDSAALVVSLLLWPPASSGRRLPEFRTDWYPSSARAATQMPNRRACPRSSAIANFLQHGLACSSEPPCQDSASSAVAPWRAQPYKTKPIRSRHVRLRCFWLFRLLGISRFSRVGHRLNLRTSRAWSDCRAYPCTPPCLRRSSRADKGCPGDRRTRTAGHAYREVETDRAAHALRA